MLRIRRSLVGLQHTISVDNADSKLIEVLRFIAKANVKNMKFGKLKLAKTMFYSDFRAHYALGAPVTGLAYEKRDNGPVFLVGLWDRIKAGDIENLRIERRATTKRDQERLVSGQDADESVFTQSELAILRTVISELWDKDSDAVSDESHGSAWNSVKMGQKIPYESAFIAEDVEITEEDVEFAHSLI